MAYLSKNNKKIFFGKTIGAVLIFATILLAFAFGKLTILGEPLRVVGSVVWKIENSAIDTVARVFDFLQLQKNLVQENENLKNQMWDIQLEFSNKKLLLAENKELKALLGRKDAEPQTILANVVSKPFLSMYNSLVVDVGEDYQIKKGAKVLAGVNLIGVVETVSAKSAQVKLYSFPKDKLTVAVGFNKILTEAEGKGDGVFEIKLPQGVAVELGDSVALPETDLFILGAVEQITKKPEDPFQIILFKSAVNIFELRWVQILKE